jgi:hypothetical protein
MPYPYQDLTELSSSRRPRRVRPVAVIRGERGRRHTAGFTAVILAATSAQAAALLVTDALIERFGLLTIIVLGETLTDVIAGLAREPVSGLTLAVGLVAVVVGFGAWWTYFDFAGHRHPRPEPAASLRWMVSHLPPTAAPVRAHHEEWPTRITGPSRSSMTRCVTAASSSSDKVGFCTMATR